VERYQRVSESGPDAILVVDAAGRIERANAQTERPFGYAPDGLSDQTAECLIPQRLRDANRVRADDRDSHLVIRFAEFRPLETAPVATAALQFRALGAGGDARPAGAAGAAGGIDCPSSGLVICAFAVAGRTARPDSKERTTP
jgi:PAS domain-containing protein